MPRVSGGGDILVFGAPPPPHSTLGGSSAMPGSAQVCLVADLELRSGESCEQGPGPFPAFPEKEDRH